VKAFLSRPIEGDWPYLWIDATYVKVRQNGRIVSVAVIIALGVNSDGRREVLGMDIGPSEAETFWTAFLRKLARRGLRGVKLVISDGHPRFAGGRDIAQTGEGRDVSEPSEAFAALDRMLATHDTSIAMAGDTHDFEYYRESLGGNGGRVMHRFVNGGGGAYLSIGTALDFQASPRPGLGILSAH
jgi:hypothetical protein